MTIRFLSQTLFWRRFKRIFILFLPCLVCLLVGCKSKIDYTPYISELRSNILLATSEEFSLKIYAVKKEIPYRADGIPREKTTRLEAYLHAPAGNESCDLSFTIDGREFQGEMSFDNVKAEYFFACTLDISDAKQIPCTIQYGNQTIELTAYSIRTENTLTAINILSILEIEEQALFSSMTDKYGFSGEIYIRLIYEDSPYYYVGIIERSGVSHAFLINAQSGKILAKRTM
jgi:hypothetical protein